MCSPTEAAVQSRVNPCQACPLREVTSAGAHVWPPSTLTSTTVTGSDACPSPDLDGLADVDVPVDGGDEAGVGAQLPYRGVL